MPGIRPLGGAKEMGSPTLVESELVSATYGD